MPISLFAVFDFANSDQIPLNERKVPRLTNGFEGMALSDVYNAYGILLIVLVSSLLAEGGDTPSSSIALWHQNLA